MFAMKLFVAILKRFGVISIEQKLVEAVKQLETVEEGKCPVTVTVTECEQLLPPAIDKDTNFNNVSILMSY